MHKGVPVAFDLHVRPSSKEIRITLFSAHDSNHDVVHVVT